MSETEYHKGTLTLIEGLSNLDFESIIALLQKRGYSFEEIDIDDEYFYSKEVVRLNDDYYAIVDKELDGSELSLITINGDGDIEYLISFYNGGASLEEALESRLSEQGII